MFKVFGDDAEPSEDESPPDTNTVRVRLGDVASLGFFPSDGLFFFQVKPSSHHKGPYAFQELQMKQNLSGEHVVRSSF